MDEERIVKGDCAAPEELKKIRKQNKRKQIIQLDAFQKSEGIQYQPKGYHSNAKRLLFFSP